MFLRRDLFFNANLGTFVRAAEDHAFALVEVHDHRITIFSPLSPEQMLLIVDLQMKQIRERLAEHGLTVDLTEAAREWLAREGYDPSFGARPLRRALQKHVESTLSVKILQGEFEEGDTVIVDFDEGEGVIFRRPDEGAAVRIEEEVSA